MTCTGDQVTDQTCSFNCNSGFSLFGSSLRECQPENVWTGIAPYCVAKHCSPLPNIPNGYVLQNIKTSCDSVVTSACEIRCVEDYSFNDTKPFYQTCVTNNTSGGVHWTKPPVCECEKDYACKFN